MTLSSLAMVDNTVATPVKLHSATPEQQQMVYYNAFLKLQFFFQHYPQWQDE